MALFSTLTRATGRQGIDKLTFTSNLATRQRAAFNRATAAEENLGLARAERMSARRASVRGARIRAQGQATAAGIRAQAAATASSRLLVQFEAEKLQRDQLRTRATQTAVGRKAGAFGASGVVSIGAQQEVGRQETLKSNIAAIQGATRKEQILGSARSAITGALATGASAAAGAAAASQFGQLFERRVSKDSGIDVTRSAFL